MKKTMGLVVIALTFCLYACRQPSAPRDAPPRLTGMVTITYSDNNPFVEDVLYADTARLDGTGTLFFQWRRGTVNVGDGYSTYEVEQADIGHVITVIVMREGFTGAVIGGPTGLVVDQHGAPLSGSVSIDIPTIWDDGYIEVGDILVANTNRLGGIGTIFFQWMRSRDGLDWIAIAGANSHTYTVQAADMEHSIRVEVGRAGNSTSLHSPWVGPVYRPGVDLPPPIPTPTPELDITISFANFQDRGPVIPDQSVSYIGAGSVLFTVDDPGQYDSISWLLDGIEVPGEGILNEEFRFYARSNLLGINTLTVEVVIGGRTYSTIIRVTVTP